MLANPLKVFVLREEKFGAVVLISLRKRNDILSSLLTNYFKVFQYIIPWMMY